MTGITLGLDTALKGLNAMSTKQLPSLEVLRKSFGYNPTTGDIINLKTDRVLPPNSRGYLRLHLDGRVLQGHRVAWAIFHNTQPDISKEIDHIDGNPSNNRIANLRLVSKTENLRNKNQYKSCKHGYPGIIHSNDRKKCWRAQIGINGTVIKVGSFRCKTAAIFARKQAEMKYGFTDLAGDAKWQLS